MSASLPNAGPDFGRLGRGACLRTLSAHNLTRVRLPEYERQLGEAASVSARPYGREYRADPAAHRYLVGTSKVQRLEPNPPAEAT